MDFFSDCFIFFFVICENLEEYEDKKECEVVIKKIYLFLILCVLVLMEWSVVY